MSSIRTWKYVMRVLIGRPKTKEAVLQPHMSAFQQTKRQLDPRNIDKVA
jgi:hypothetical protein